MWKLILSEGNIIAWFLYLIFATAMCFEIGFKTILWGKFYYYAYFIDENSESQSGY